MHSEFVSAVTQASEVRELGRAVGAAEAMDHLATVRDKAAAEGATERWLEGFDEGVGNVDTEAVPWFAANREYMDREATLPSTDDLGFDPTNLLAVLEEIHSHGVRVGHSTAIAAARDQRDTETAPDPEDYITDPGEDEEEDEDEVSQYQEQVDYVAGLHAVAICLLEQFPDDDPNPGWEPS